MAVGSNDEIGMWMLAQRMTHNFCAGVCATTHKWKIIQLENGEYPKLMTRTNIGDMGEPIGVVLSATNTIRFLSQAGDAFALTKLCPLQWNFSYSEPAEPSKIVEEEVYEEVEEKASKDETKIEVVAHSTVLNGLSMLIVFFRLMLFKF
uniref:Homeodomain protein GL2-like 1 n=1 Tax=Solanum tuberosum TaxID=4113 RepID=M1B3S9_SOLTU